MDVRPELQLESMMKAMEDIVLPAVDPDNRLAQEQARLVIATLRLVAQRGPLAWHFERDELARYVALAKQLDERANAGDAKDGAVLDDLRAATRHGADVLDRARAAPAELEQASYVLRARVGALVEWARENADGDQYAQVARAVLDNAEVELERERALVIDIGFEPDPEDLPRPIAEQLGLGRENIR